MMEVVIQLSTDVESGAAAADPAAAVRRRVRELGLSLQAVDPGGSLSSYYRVEVSSPEIAARVVEAVRGLPGVTAAYVKPSDEPP